MKGAFLFLAMVLLRVALAVLIVRLFVLDYLRSQQEGE